MINLFLLIKNFKVEKWPLGSSHLGCIRATYASRSQHVCGRMHFQPHFHRCIRVAPVARMRSYAARMQTCAYAYVCIRGTYVSICMQARHPCASGGTGCSGRLRGRADSKTSGCPRVGACPWCAQQCVPVAALHIWSAAPAYVHIRSAYVTLCRIRATDVCSTYVNVCSTYGLFDAYVRILAAYGCGTYVPRVSHTCRIRGTCVARVWHVCSSLNHSFVGKSCSTNTE